MKKFRFKIKDLFGILVFMCLNFYGVIYLCMIFVRLEIWVLIWIFWFIMWIVRYKCGYFWGYVFLLGNFSK